MDEDDDRAYLEAEERDRVIDEAMGEEAYDGPLGRCTRGRDADEGADGDADEDFGSSSSEDEAERSRRTGEPMRTSGPSGSRRTPPAAPPKAATSRARRRTRPQRPRPQRPRPAAPRLQRRRHRHRHRRHGGPTALLRDPGHKRQKLVLKDDAPNGDEDDAETEQTSDPMDEEKWYEQALDVAETRRIPCLLSWMMPVSTSFKTSVLSFEVIYARRCIEGREYYAPVAKADSDGLWAFLCQQVLALLEPAPSPAAETPPPSPPPSPRRHRRRIRTRRRGGRAQRVAMRRFSGADGRRGQRGGRALVEPGMSEEEIFETTGGGGAPSTHCRRSRRSRRGGAGAFSQLTERDGNSEAVVTSASLGELGADVDGNVLRLDDGRVLARPRASRR